MQQTLNFDTPTIIWENQKIINQLRNRSKNLPKSKREYAMRQVKICLALVQEEQPNGNNRIL